MRDQPLFVATRITARPLLLTHILLAYGYSCVLCFRPFPWRWDGRFSQWLHVQGRVRQWADAWEGIVLLAPDWHQVCYGCKAATSTLFAACLYALIGSRWLPSEALLSSPSAPSLPFIAPRTNTIFYPSPCSPACLIPFRLSPAGVDIIQVHWPIRRQHHHGQGCIQLGGRQLIQGAGPARVKARPRAVCLWPVQSII